MDISTLKTEECTIIILQKRNNTREFYQPLNSKQKALEHSSQFHWLGEQSPPRKLGQNFLTETQINCTTLQN